MKLHDSVEGFLRYLKDERQVSSRTIQAYRSDIDQFHAFLSRIYPKTMDATDVDTYAIRRYVAWLVNQQKQPRTVARKLAAIRGLYQFLVHEGVMLQSPGQEVKAPTIHSVSKILTNVQVAAFIEKADGDTRQVLRDRAILETLYSTGARLSELVALNWADVGWEEGLVVLHGPKNKERRTPIGEPALESLAVYRESVSEFQRLTSEPIFLNRYGRRASAQTIAQVLSKYSIGLRDGGVSSRDLRRAFATHLLHEGANAAGILAMLGTGSCASIGGSHPNDLFQDYRRAHPRARE